MRIDPKEVVFDPASVADPNGKVFWWQGKVYRAVSRKSASLYRVLFDHRIIARVIDSGLIETEITSLSLDGYDLILSHRTIPFRAHPFEWCGEMLRDAALLTCDLNLTLASFGLCTQDAHCWNILFDGSTPKFVDFGSIVPARTDFNSWLWWHKEFQDYFLYPLYLIASGNGDWARRLLFNLNEIITKEAIINLLPLKKRTEYRQNNLLTYPSRIHSAVSFFGQVRRTIEEIEFPRKAIFYNRYNNDEFRSFELPEAGNIWNQTVLNVVKGLGPLSIINVGANNSWYSLMAGKMGIHVIALDMDEMLINSLYRDASKDRLSILPLIMDIGAPSQACIRSAYNEYYPPAELRLKSEMVLALDILPHQVFKRGFRFKQIVKQLAAFTNRWLLVEFAPPNDYYISKRDSDEFGWYSLEGFITELEKIFSHCEILDSFPAPRQLLLCER